MKLKVGECVYLQKYEIAHITHDLNSFPAGIFDELFSGDGEPRIFFMNGREDGFRFDCIFKNPQTVKWLMDQDWIVDYDEYAEMPVSKLEALIKRLDTERSIKINEFNAKNEGYRKEHYAKASEEFNQSGHKIFSLECILRAHKGKVKFTFPNEYQHTKEEKPGFLRRLFSHSAQ